MPGPGSPWASSAKLSTVTAIEPAEQAPARDPHRPARLLQAERDALLPILHRTPDRAFDRPTACPGWSVRDVLAHCASALSRVAACNLHAFTPALNEVEVAAHNGGYFAAQGSTADYAGVAWRGVACRVAGR